MGCVVERRQLRSVDSVEGQTGGLVRLVGGCWRVTVAGGKCGRSGGNE